MNYLIILGIMIITLMLVSNRSKDNLHMIQLEEYKSENYKKWITDNRERAYSFGKPSLSGKNPLVFTERATRLYTMNLVLSGILVMIASLPYLATGNEIYVIVTLMVAAIVYRQQPDTMYYSSILIRPVEENINMGFYKSAQEKIRDREDLTVIGITGSFGKTSTEVILDTILREKFNVLSTPESYNTPMGLSKIINTELNDEHQVFIAEMGAREVGEIREVAELCQPKIGVLASIGPVHMETFKNIDNIAKTKYELIDLLPTDGVAVFNYDNEHIKKLADKTFKEKKLYALDNVEDADIYADDIVVSELGSTFSLRDNEGNSMGCTTKLLGRHNVYNILAGASVARILGLSFEEISRGISKIQPIPHRLNIRDSGTGVIIIDDTFNSNPIGTKAALEVLGQFKEGKKIIVTPGMVELGDMEEEANREFGNNIGKVCDYVILIGKERTKPIYEGLMEANYNESNIFVVNSLDEANIHVGKLAKPKDVVLFENDLPDNYS